MSADRPDRLAVAQAGGDRLELDDLSTRRLPRHNRP